ncbi:MAG TPA: response regulator transcription factor [Ktedonobacteraceae bacterium]|nr:response regulator transcription factor [Ktedonobacteraceae bacterium]
MNELQSEERRIRVVVVDDHLIVRDGLRLILQIEGKDMEMVGDAADGATALRLIEETQPDVVLMDLRMPGMDGVEAIAQIRTRWPQVAVVILTTYNEDDLMLRGLHAGACGYLLKDVNQETLLHSIRRAARGETLLQPEVFARLLSLTQPSPTPSPSAESTAKKEKVDLTERERNILTGVAHGERSKEIAARLGITAATVAAHLTNIYSKLGADSRASAVAIALQRGLLSMGDEDDLL